MDVTEHWTGVGVFVVVWHQPFQNRTSLSSTQVHRNEEKKSWADSLAAQQQDPDCHPEY